MSPEDDRQLRSLVRQAVNASSLGVRQLERAMGLGSGYLERLLDGRLEIKVRHLVDLARLLRVPPSHFLHFGCPDANRSAVSGLGKVLGLKEQPDPFLTSRTAARDGVPASREELVETIRGVVREILGTGEPKKA
ncbi:MAG TPA: hypothetical protein VF756_24045 [Thermoanaerobaculia bacterium]